MRHQSIATRSIRRTQRAGRAPTRSSPDVAAIQIFVFRLDAFVGTELFGAGAPITVGRSHQADLHLEGDSVSRMHCQVSFDGNTLRVEDLGSGNGTFVNRERIVRSHATLGIDAITVGNYTLKVRVLYAESRRPTHAPAAEPTTRIEAILSSGGTEELPLDLEGQVDERLYADAIRRKSSEAAPTSPGPTIRMRDQIEDDSTMMSPEEISVSVSVSSTSGAELDPEVEARLKDLDDLIASLDARLEGRKASMVPWRNEPSEPSERSVKTGKKSISTREFARDLASRLAVDGELINKSKAATKKRERTADVIPLRPKTKTGTTAQRVEVEIIESPPKPATRTPTSGIPVVPKALLDGPETELLDSDLPPRPAMPTPLTLKRETFIEEPPHPRKTGAHAVADKKTREPQLARLITQSSMRVDVQPLLNGAPGSEDSSLYDDVWQEAPAPKALITRRPSKATKGEIRVEGAPAKAKTPPPVAPSRIGPPPLPVKADAKKLEAKRTEAKKTEPNRKTEHGKEAPPPLPRRATEVRPQSRIDDFDKSTAGFEGVEISARAGGKVVAVSILRGPGEQYILGHATPQGQIAPAKAHLGLRLVRINSDRTVDLVFPRDVGGHLFRGTSTVMFSELAEGRKYSCLRMEAQDIATIILGEGRAAVTYHLRFLRRVGSLQKAEKRAGQGN